ncbi:sigma factor-like helix-turn-helix DNA-binding protein [Streptomyces sp. CB02261]|uniref:sigma factor-like helix-turn-helix DNA-binding protein n=1 Tax=Streptomyces sp. CB02261 TaxID=1703940 RepID=UPI000940023F|nr:sigma factor-like helix-turn-helix DNA-binding protein [Streptomyces sp. CB02261]OKJ55201.1 RNA polymerase subunit sigma-70 [Streptomyces sp. CB02261]
MPDDTFLTALTGCFDAHEEQLRRVALRMTGSRAEAEAALAAARADLGRKDGSTSVRAWLTALVGRECVRGLQERRVGGAGRPAGAGEGVVTDTAGGAVGSGNGSVWLALFVALDALGADERDAYVLHDVFGLPPHETARITGGSPETVTRLARRARERIRGGGTARSDGDERRQRVVVGRFLTAARARDARTLAAVLDPDVIAWSEHGPVHGAPAVAERAAAFARFADVARPALVDGAVGAVAFVAGRPVSALAFTLRQDRIVALSVTTGEDRVRALDLAFPDC